VLSRFSDDLHRTGWSSVTEIVSNLSLRSSIETHRDRNIMMVDCLHRRMAHLLPLTASRRRLHLRLLAIMFPETHVHIALNVGRVRQNVADHTLLNGPAEEVELAHRRLLDRRLATDLEADALATAKRIKEALRIRLELTLVMEVDHELTRRRVFCQGIADVELLGIVRDEPVDEAEAHRARPCQNGKHLFQSPRLVVEVLEPADDEILFALDAVLHRLTLILKRLHVWN